MKLIFKLVVTLIPKITVFASKKTHTWSCRSQCTHYERLFGAACRAEASLTNISLIIAHYGQWRHLLFNNNQFFCSRSSRLIDVWFYGASCYIFSATIDLLHQTFDSCLINRNDDTNWPPRRCDLTLFYVGRQSRQIRDNRAFESQHS